ncbi:hypothetical protein [Actinocorallia longicatena]|uniref:hypothetical protein n=1 Tax=Actinocorallia longicatena TaxID=111803 RepID=UPI0031DDF4D9
MSETRFDLLVRLAWQINALRRAVMVVMPVNGEPVVWVSMSDGRRFAVMAVQQGGGWIFVWGVHYAPTEPMADAAALIAAVTS